jgi:hypothetical protein
MIHYHCSPHAMDGTKVWRCHASMMMMMTMTKVPTANGAVPGSNW